MSNYRKAVIAEEKSNKQEIRQNIRRISFKSMKQEDIALEV